MAKATRPSRKSRPATPRTRPTTRTRRVTKEPSPAAKDLSTEEKIMAAAQKLFTQKGFSATRTRDIAKEAGINLALLNYYFRSKEKLFDIVMAENFRQFIKGISVNLTNETTTMEEKIGLVATAYIDFLTRHPDLPLFILSEIRGNPSVLAQKINEEVAPLRSHLFKQIQEAGQQGKIGPIEPFHFIANLIGLTVFPFLGRPLLQRITNINDQQFRDLMEERKKLVPLWISAIMNAKK